MPPSAIETTEDVIVVDGVRFRGRTLSDIEPEVSLDEADIAAYGVSSLFELLAVLAPETASGRSRRGGGGGPVVLLNGRRISGFREIGQYPPEALARVEVLPEEVALSYGFPADARVINFVLKPNVVVSTVENELMAPEQGGTSTHEMSFQRLNVDGDKRFSVNVNYVSISELLESERDFISEDPALPFATPGNLGAQDFGAPIGSLLGGGADFTVAALQGASFTAPIIGAQNALNEQSFRTLVPKSDTVEIGVSRATDFWAESVLTFSGQLEYGKTESLLGLAEVALDLPASNPFVPFADGLTLYASLPQAGALKAETETRLGNLGVSVVSKPGRTNWTLTGNYQHTNTETLTDLGIDQAPLQQAVDAGGDPFVILAGPTGGLQRMTESTDRTGMADFVLNTKAFTLPGGDVTLTTQAGFESITQEVHIREEGERSLSALDRDTFRSQVSLDLPIFGETFAPIGDLSLNGNAEVEDFSDFGTLYTYGGGVNWRPFESFQFLLSYTREEGAPTIDDLGNPLLVTPNVRVFDFVTGETVLATQTLGGNPSLLADQRDVTKLGLQWEPFDEQDLTINIDYTGSQIEDEARSFPSLTQETEAAFPDRFTRDASGTLIAIDQRPVNFEDSTLRQIRTGINWSKRLGQQRGGPPNRRGARPEQNAQTSSRATPTRSRRPGRIRVSAFHTMTLEDTILIRQGLDELDLLNGSAIGDEGGTARHTLTTSLRSYNKGISNFAQIQWQSGTNVDGDTAGGEDLRFSDRLLADYRISYDLTFSDWLMDKARWLEDSRVSFDVENIFNERIRVTDASGATPLRYQPDLVDPQGRIFEVEFRKRF
ncbi:MAG: hypothetical protein AAF788_02420 [Pseudomonadota bacterium]